MASPQQSLRRYYGALPDPPDHRDRKCRYSYKQIPTDPEVDLRSYVPQVLNQGALGSCTANAVVAAFVIDAKKQKLYYFEPSRLFLYYNTREIEGDVSTDSGASLRNTVKAINKCGVCPEKRIEACDFREGQPDGSRRYLPYWPYETQKFRERPPPQCYSEAVRNNICKYERLSQEINQLRACLKSGSPFVFGFEVFPSFDRTQCFGIMPMPTKGEVSHSSHAVVAVGYDDERQKIVVLNSWGCHWGQNGYFFMPYEFIENENYCRDFWKIELVCEDPDLAAMPACKKHDKKKKKKK